MNYSASITPPKGNGGFRGLRRRLLSLQEVAVAVSGGVDSMTLAFVAHRWLGSRATMFHAVSPAVPGEATARVREHAGRWGWQLRVIDAGEFSDPDYLRNPANRCFFCKTNLYAAIAQATEKQMVSGANLDDLGDYRPGLLAAANADVRHPYVEANIGKASVRAIARRFGLGDLSELPASPCLASRIATGITVEAARLRLIEEVEQQLRRRFPGAEALRCRVMADRLEVQVDAPLLDRLDGWGKASLGREVAAIAADHGERLPVVVAPYIRGSAFLHEGSGDH